ncbi:MAG: hypothetical protein FJ271_29245 [Planctomycetes bacterium]|nr:hypothetical protein [Planctomycetota bacterium]
MHVHFTEPRRHLDDFIAVVLRGASPDSKQLRATLSVHVEGHDIELETLDEEMTREGAIEAAKELADREGIGDVLVFSEQMGHWAGDTRMRSGRVIG